MKWEIQIFLIVWIILFSFYAGYRMGRIKTKLDVLKDVVEMNDQLAEDLGEDYVKE